MRRVAVLGPDEHLGADLGQEVEAAVITGHRHRGAGPEAGVAAGVPGQPHPYSRQVVGVLVVGHHADREADQEAVGLPLVLGRRRPCRPVHQIVDSCTVNVVW